MALKTTIHSMKEFLEEMKNDLGKTERGNKAAAQRVRTNSIKFSKVAKTFRKESISTTKGKSSRKSTKKSKKTTKKAKR